jgi:hypothetical protein
MQIYAGFSIIGAYLIYYMIIFILTVINHKRAKKVNLIDNFEYKRLLPLSFTEEFEDNSLLSSLFNVFVFIRIAALIGIVSIPQSLFYAQIIVSVFLNIMVSNF